MIRFVNDKSLHGLDPLDFSNLLCVKLQETETFFQEDQEDEVESPCDNANRHHPFESAEFLPLLDEVHALEFHSHDDGSMPRQRLRIHKPCDFQDSFFGQFADTSSDRVFRDRELPSNGFEGFPSIPKLLDNLKVYLVYLHGK